MTLCAARVYDFGMPKILVVFERIPEETSLYVLEVPDETLLRFKKIAGKHGGFVGVSEEDEAIIAEVDQLIKADGIEPRSIQDTSGITVDSIIVTGWML